MKKILVLLSMLLVLCSFSVSAADLIRDAHYATLDVDSVGRFFVRVRDRSTGNPIATSAFVLPSSFTGGKGFVVVTVSSNGGSVNAFLRDTIFGANLASTGAVATTVDFDGDSQLKFDANLIQLSNGGVDFNNDLDFNDPGEGSFSLMNIGGSQTFNAPPTTPANLNGIFEFSTTGTPPTGILGTFSPDMEPTGGPPTPEFNNIAGVIAILVVVAVAFLLLKKKQ